MVNSCGEDPAAAGVGVDGGGSGCPGSSATAVSTAAAQQLAAQEDLLELPPGSLRTPRGAPVEFARLKDLREKGAGEFCKVCEGRLDVDGTGLRRVAVKMLKPKYEASVVPLGDLRREISLLSQMSHPHIVGFVAHGCAADRGVPFGCFDLFAHPLSFLLPTKSDTGKALPWKTSKAAREWPVSRGVAVGLQLARALRYCHDEFMPGYRLLHRDIKPDNIGCFADGRIVLADFGLCKLWKVDSAASDDERRKLTGLTGSLRYMAPEVALQEPYNHKAEVFSFTSLLYHFLSHQKPFSWMTPDTFLADACRNGKRPLLSGKWPGDVQALMAAGWSSDSRARPEFAKVVVALEEAIGRPQSLAEVLERSKAPSSRSSAQ